MAEEILLIDKDKSYAEALGVYLVRQQVKVFVANTCEEVLLLFDNICPEIIFADPGLPDKEIIYLLKQIKNTHSDIQIIIMTSAHDIDQVMNELRTDVMTYLTKPVKSHALDLALKQARKWIKLNKELDSYAKNCKDLQTAQTLYQQLFDEVPCYISVQDCNFRLTATNRFFKKDFGSEIGSFCYEVYKHRSSPCPKCPVASTFKDGLSHQTEEIVTSKSGKRYNVLTWTAPIRNSTGQITQVMEMSTNITQVRQLQDHLTSLGLMLGSMSHGVKGMLTALDGGTYQLESGIAKQDMGRVKKAFTQVKQMSSRIRKMVLEILYYAKSKELQYKTIDATKLAQTVIETVSPVAASNGIDLNISISRSLGKIEIDPNWIEAALVNFMENGIDACTFDRNKSKHQVKFSATATGSDHICFIISDNGMGMDQETQDKMFTLFFTSKGSQGTGLGLFIANHVIQQHGGTIKVDSKLHKGSRFEICLPRTRPELPRILDFPNKQAL